ncbi:MAG: acyl-CoA dehydratase activase [Erysipelotrichales bacterium]|nr:acyl-CoA dehydratase activase [Erysipelotrichales bacterium]
MIKIGVDVGSTTVKILAEKENKAIFMDYCRHNALVRQTIIDMLKRLQIQIGDEPVTLAITGSAGMGVAEEANLTFVQEVIAATTAVDESFPDADVAIELGGEDAKIIFFGRNTDQRMNGTCAGGTGAFIDQMATLLDINILEMNELSKKHKKIYPIASRCGVFAKTDIQSLLNQGVNKEDIAASIFQAIVNQAISGLAQGRKIEKKVMFLGGPLYFLSELREAFIRTLNIAPEDVIFPENAHYFVAHGAAKESTQSKVLNLTQILEKVEAIKDKKSANKSEPLFKNEADYQTFLTRQNRYKAASADLQTYKGKAYLGIDAGSTTTKIILIGENCEILHEFYAGNKGNPVDVIKEELLKIFRSLNADTKVVSSCVTGYGEELMKKAFLIDFGMVETFAHFHAAKFFNPQVDYIIDIGGQDMKCFKIKNGTIDSIMLNEACSSGCGSFIETFAKALGYTAEEFSKLALFAPNPADLGSRCTVFMNSSVKQAQKEGSSVADVAGGIAISVVKNALYKVIRVSNPDELGDNIVVQGGTFYNDAVLRAFEREINKEVIRPAISGLMGAFGCALIAKTQEVDAKSRLSLEHLEQFSFTSRSTHCKLCSNHCLLTVNNFSDGRRYIGGNKCEGGLALPIKSEIPNVFAECYDALFRLPTIEKPKRGTVGIPLVLNFFDTYPFWNGFFNALDIGIILSDKSSKELYFSGQETIPSDTVCYPAKMVHGHIKSLFDKKVNKIFYPVNVYNFKEKSYVDNHYNCPVVAYYSELIEGNLDEITADNFINPYLVIGSPLFAKKTFESLKAHFSDLKLRDIEKAIKAGYEVYNKFKDDIQIFTDIALTHAQTNNLKVIVLAGRPYHVDPAINHGIDKLLVTLGAVVIPEQGVSPKAKAGKLDVLNQWTFHSRLYDAAYFVRENRNMELVQLVSFGCGLDAVTTDETRRILEEAGKYYTQIKIDEISNLGVAKIRLRTLLESLAVKDKGDIYG